MRKRQKKIKRTSVRAKKEPKKPNFPAAKVIALINDAFTASITPASFREQVREVGAELVANEIQKRARDEASRIRTERERIHQISTKTRVLISELGVLGGDEREAMRAINQMVVQGLERIRTDRPDIFDTYANLQDEIAKLLVEEINQLRIEMIDCLRSSYP